MLVNLSDYIYSKVGNMDQMRNQFKYNLFS